MWQILGYLYVHDLFSVLVSKGFLKVSLYKEKQTQNYDPRTQIEHPTHHSPCHIHVVFYKLYQISKITIKIRS